MPRMARAVLPGVTHHVTQRGVNRQTVFLCRSDYEVYLGLVRASARRCEAWLVGYCLMPNHVHWVVSPPEADSLTHVFGEAHSRYAHYANSKLNRSGHFWQNRFFSCALDGAHLWAALRYVERNPVRAGLVAAARNAHGSRVGAAGERLFRPADRLAAVRRSGRDRLG